MQISHAPQGELSWGKEEVSGTISRRVADSLFRQQTRQDISNHVLDFLMPTSEKIARLILASVLGGTLIILAIKGCLMWYEELTWGELYAPILGLFIYGGSGSLLIYSQIRVICRTGSRQETSLSAPRPEDTGGQLLAKAGSGLIKLSYVLFSGAAIYFLFVVFGGIFGWITDGVSGIPIGIAGLFGFIFYATGKACKRASTT